MKSIILSVAFGLSLITAPAFASDKDATLVDAPTPAISTSAIHPSLATSSIHINSDDRRIHKFDYALYAGIASYRTLDFISTEQALHRGGHEVELPQFVVNNAGVFVAFEALATAGEVGGSAYLIHHGHRKLARVANAVSIGIGAPTVGHNFLVHGPR